MFERDTEPAKLSPIEVERSEGKAGRQVVREIKVCFPKFKNQKISKSTIQ